LALREEHRKEQAKLLRVRDMTKMPGCQIS
jgi:hypothetical protein